MASKPTNCGTIESIERWTRRAEGGDGLSREDGLRLARDPAPVESLYPYATRIRQAHRGKTARFCAIVNARSGACREDCRYCAQSAHHATGVETYGLLTAERLLAAADGHKNDGISTFGIVTSGPTVTADETERLAHALKRMKKEVSFSLCASLGALDTETLRTLKEAGLSRFHHNLETSRRFFPTICSTHDWDERVTTIRNAQAAGLEVCSGGLFGLGETWEDRVDLALSLRELGVQSVPVNFLVPVPGTPLADRAPLSAEEALRILVLYRFLLPDASIRVCGGRPTVLGDRQHEIFRAGADALMTGDYLTTAGLSPATDRAMAEDEGMELS